MKKLILILKKIFKYSVLTYALYMIILVIILLVVFGIICSKKINSEFKPNCQLDTKWVSDNPDIFFTVTDDGKHNICLGEFNLNSKIINVKLTIGPGRDSSMIVDDYDAMVINNFEYDPKIELFRGDCEFHETKCVVTITESYINDINVDDVIEFKRVDELPEWAVTE
jgi:hypothetical protein